MTSQSKVGMPHFQSFRLLEPQSSVNHCQWLPIQRESMCISLNPPVPSVVRERNLSTWRMQLRRGPTLVKAIPCLQVGGNLLVRMFKAVGGTRKKKGLLTAPTRHAGPALIPSSLLRVGPLDSLCLWDHDRNHWRNELLHRRGDVRKISWTHTLPSVAKTERPATGRHAHNCATLSRGRFRV